MADQNILVVGGAGYIGSHAAKLLAMHGYSPIVFDNLSLGNRKNVICGTLIEGDIASVQDLDKVFKSYPFKAVMHFAALIDVGESVVDPGKYYINNVSYTLNLLEAMRRHGVKTFVFSSSAAIFGTPQQERVAEDHPCHPINPYGRSKLMVEQILQDYDAAYGIKSSCLRYFNAAGGDPERKIKNHKLKETNLIPIILRNLKNAKSTTVTIFGTDYPTPDGTCIRDYIHIDDLGAAHILAMEQLLKEGVSTHYNLGSGQGFSVREVIRAAEEVTGVKIHAVEGSRRAGDPPVLIADSQKARRELGWLPKFPDLKTMISDAWQALD